MIIFALSAVVAVEYPDYNVQLRTPMSVQKWH